jgi:flagellar M-ring protein FliF
MANVEQTQTSISVRRSDEGLLAVSKSALASTRNFIDQPSFRRAFPTILATLTAVAALVLYWGLQQPNMTTLYSGLSEAEKSKVLAALDNNGISVQLDPATGEILVPVDLFHRAKISLAAQGLPAFSSDNADGLENLPMGVSRSVENLKLRQVRENELAKSISEISTVKSVRVHLALPEKSVFVRNQANPTASVFVSLKNGRSLDATQVNAITNLVSSSVPNMNPKDVSIVDQFGNLLSNAPDDPDQVLADHQLEYRMRLENIYKSRIQSLVTPIVGASNLNAQVNLEIDFTRRELSQEIIDPSGAAPISEQSSLNVTAKKEAIGIPGAISNQPPVEATVNQSQNQAGDTSNTNSVEPNQFETKSSTELKNYENSKKFETVKNPSNVITKINAALLIRDRKIVDPDTQEITYEPISSEVISELEKLVKSAIGFDEERGDSLTISSQPFVEEFDGVEQFWYDTPWFRNMAENSLMVLLLAIVVLGVVRPMLNKILVPTASTNSVMELYAEAESMAELATRRAEETAAVEVDEGESLDAIKAKLKPKKRSGISSDLLDTANTYDDKVAIVRMIVNDEAGRVANVFKQMMRQDLEYLK